MLGAGWMLAACGGGDTFCFDVTATRCKNNVVEICEYPVWKPTTDCGSVGMKCYSGQGACGVVVTACCR